MAKRPRLNMYNCWMIRHPKHPLVETDSEVEARKLSRQARKEWLSTVYVVAGAFVIALLITLFGFRPYRVDGQSMEQTLQNNDRVIIDKIPRSWARLTGHAYIPKRGDIVVFNEVGAFDSSIPGSKDLIKRVIGLP